MFRKGLQKPSIHSIIQQEIIQWEEETGETEIYSLPELAVLSPALASVLPPTLKLLQNICEQHILLVLLGFTPQLPGMLSPLPNSMCSLCRIFPHDCSLLFVAPTHWLPRQVTHLLKCRVCGSEWLPPQVSQLFRHEGGNWYCSVPS